MCCVAGTVAKLRFLRVVRGTDQSILILVPKGISIFANVPERETEEIRGNRGFSLPADSSAGRDGSVRVKRRRNSERSGDRRGNKRPNHVRHVRTETVKPLVGYPLEGQRLTRFLSREINIKDLSNFLFLFL